MMPTVKKDWQTQSALVERGDRTTDTVVYLVEGLDGISDEFRARTAALELPEIPSQNSAHPYYPGLKCISRRAQGSNFGPGVLVVTVEYANAPETPVLDRTQPYGPVSWGGGSRSETVETVRDIFGRPMVVTYDGTPVLDEFNSSSGQITTTNSYGRFRHAYVHFAETVQSLVTILATRWERDDPLRTLADFQGRVNQGTFRGLPSETVLLRDSSYSSDPQGGFNVQYSFVYKPQSWRLEAAIQLASTIGFQVPRDATPGNGIELFQIYPTGNFSALGLE